MRLDQLNASEERFETIVEGCGKSLDNLQEYIDSEVRNVKTKFNLEVDKLNNRFIAEIKKLRKQLEKAERYSTQLENALDAYKRTLERETKAENRKLKERIKELEAFIDSIEFVDEEEEEGEKEKEEEKEVNHFLRARTTAILQKILMLISKWSGENLPAEDFEIVSRAILIPSVMMRISNYEPNYLLKEFPNCRNVVINGRKYISELRKEYPTHLCTSTVWNSSSEEIKIWWTDYALPEIFGWKDDRWDKDPVLNWETSNKWENNPVEQMTLFPAVYDTLYSMKSYESLTSPMKELSLELDDPRYKF
jgi:hypothetical protein